MGGGPMVPTPETDEAAEEKSAAASLSDVFPGEAVELRSLGRTVIVSEWGAAAVVREVPARLGRVMARLVPFSGELRARGVVEALPVILRAGGEDFAGLVLWSAGLEESLLERITAGELVRLAAAVVRQNRDFFDELGRLLDAAGVKLPGPESPPRSSGPGSP